ncbi:DUF1000-domain-containing protein [Coniophora puteana RWD-64-598 SS2]|uniref:DUF1000-domain-containing protein n=1 Tax=Coniophora puteana (strain RWD-64-598) TaxID=741705 RepID=A0A5M3N2S2_CONPW|nr:DUF1000-domain-containing protein [Coniophora puteana RWD-64-598 SS2]EIW85324.1 DUF1000-domain-containing protein [Coniophora puteana RWD-64-598 SS2]
MADSSADTSLLSHLDSSQINCLNESSEHNLKSILQSKALNSGPAYVLSDVDEQLLLSVHFNQTVRVRAIVIKASNTAQAPRDIKIFVNHPSIGFEDVDSDGADRNAAQVFSLSEAQVTQGQRIPLRYVRFQSVNSIHIFVSSNHGDEDQTRIDGIDFLGTPVEATKDLSGLQQEED